MASRSGRVLLGALGIAVALGGVELAGRTGLTDPRLLPLPSQVLASARGLAVSAKFLTDAAVTVTTWAGGLLITLVIAIPAGAVLGSLPRAEAVARPVIEFLRPVPAVALFPLILLLVQNDLRMKVTIVVYASVWPVLINTIYGLREVDPLAKETLRSFGFGPLSVLRRVSLPSAAPFIVTGARLAASIAFIVTIGVELLSGGVNGVGVFLIQAESGGSHTDVMLAVVAWAGAFGLAVNALLVYAEHRLFRWHHERAGTLA